MQVEDNMGSGWSKMEKEHLETILERRIKERNLDSWNALVGVGGTYERYA